MRILSLLVVLSLISNLSHATNTSGDEGPLVKSILPQEVFGEIGKYLEFKDISQLILVSKYASKTILRLMLIPCLKGHNLKFNLKKKKHTEMLDFINDMSSGQRPYLRIKVTNGRDRDIRQLLARSDFIDKLIICMHLTWDGLDGLKDFLDYEMVKQLTSLKILRGLSPDGIAYLGKNLIKFEKLKTLDLSSYKVGVGHAKDLAEGLSGLSKLESLTLEIFDGFGSGESMDILVRALSTLPHLTYLSLPPSLNDEQIRSLQILPKFLSLETLDLSLGNVDEMAMRAVVNGLEQIAGFKRLDLWIDNNEGLQHLVAPARELKGFTKLKFFGIYARYYGEVVGIQPIIGIFTNLKQVESLDLSCATFGDDGAKALAEILKDFTELRYLELRANDIGDEGAYHIAQALPKLIKLRHLGLSCNKIGDSGVEDIVMMLKDSHHLEWLDLGLNAFSKEKKCYIEEALKDIKMDLEGMGHF